MADTSLKRFFCPLPEPVATFPHPVTLTEAFVVNHIRSVLRYEPGQQILLVDPDRETAFQAKISAITKNTVQAEIQSSVPMVLSDGIPRITLAVALIKEQRWDWLLQKVTEMGVRRIIPLETAHTVIQVKDPERKQARWQAVAASAAEQSEGLFIPRVALPVSLSGFCDWAETSVSSSGHKALLLERGEEREPLRNWLAPHRKSWPEPEPEMIFTIGPEGGWDTSEINLLKARGFTPLSLGNRILRTETAAMALMSIMTYEFS